MKQCSSCGENKPKEQFHRNRSTRDGFCFYCVECRKLHRNSEVEQRANKSWRTRHANQYMLLNARSRARRSGIECTITKDDFEIGTVCPVLGIPMFSAAKRHDGSPTLDRINNNLGYVKGNVVVISWRANRIKSDASLDELKALVSFYEKLA